MGVPSSPEARRFYRCAIQRYEEARVLRKADLTTGAVYLAGYAIECILKALILDAVPRAKRAATLSSFRGNLAHDYEWLRSKYLSLGGANFPNEVTRSFALAADWTTELRYVPRGLGSADADAFLMAAETILEWAKRRF
jgi:HEPN domain-containing protein